MTELASFGSIILNVCFVLFSLMTAISLFVSMIPNAVFLEKNESVASFTVFFRFVMVNVLLVFSLI